MRKRAGVLLVGALMALAGCGGGGAAKRADAPARTGTAPSAANGASAAAIAGAAGVVAAAVGDAVLAPAAVASAATAHGSAAPSTATSTVATQPPRTHTAPTTPTVAPVAHTHIISAHATGQYAVAHVNGTFPHPAQITLTVDASPAQGGSVFWVINCLEKGGGVGHAQKQQTLQFPTSFNLPIAAAATICYPSASVQLSKSGSVSISISS